MSVRHFIARAARRVRHPHAEIDRLTERYRADQWLAREALEAQQARRLDRLLRHCWRQVPFYRAAFMRAGIQHEREVRLDALPVLTKQDLRRHFDDLASDDLDQRKWFRNRSGGSTGEPVTVIQDGHYLAHSEAIKTVGFGWSGYRLGDRLVKLWGSERDVLQQATGWKGRVAPFINNQRVLNAFIMSPADMCAYLGVLNRYRPDCVYGYAHALFELARFAEDQRVEVAAPSAIVSTSGALYPFVREKLERVFHCPVFDQYGSREVSCIAAECEQHDGLHINLQTLVVEVIDERGGRCDSGVEGDIVVTSLMNYAMPLVRYRIGDRGVLSERSCCCRRGAPMLERVTGRAMDALRRRDGTIVPAEYFIHFLGVVFNRGGIEQLQVVQHDYDEISVRLVGADPGGASEADVIRTVRMAMGDECRITIDYVDDIPVSASGKRRYTISHVSPDGGMPD